MQLHVQAHWLMKFYQYLTPLNSLLTTCRMLMHLPWKCQIPKILHFTYFCIFCKQSKVVLVGFFFYAEIEWLIDWYFGTILWEETPSCKEHFPIQNGNMQLASREVGHTGAILEQYWSSFTFTKLTIHKNNEADTVFKMLVIQACPTSLTTCSTSTE